MLRTFVLGCAGAVFLLAAGCDQLGSEDAAPGLHPLTAESSATLTPAQAAYDVLHYSLDLEIFPETEEIVGQLTMRFAVLDQLDSIELDLDPRFEITMAATQAGETSFTRNENKVAVALPASLTAGDQGEVTLGYAGAPHVAEAPPWEGGFVWSKTDDGSPWIATAVQGMGCDLWWPCKDHHADKPDEGIALNITVPPGLKVATNGVLIDTVIEDDGRSTWQWQSQHPYTGYAVALNIGPYARIRDSYQGITGDTIPIEFWALEENAEKAEELIETDAKPHLEFFERLIGPYPWGDEKVGFAETPHLGMEHQTINAYGAGYVMGEHGYDWLLHHELAHEWFGNLMTHKNSWDVWLHEGYATYMQTVYAAEVIGDVAYAHHLHTSFGRIRNCEALVRPGTEAVEASLSNSGIYFKGAWMLHTLRHYIGDEAFWRGTRRVVFGTADISAITYPVTPVYRSTEEFIEIMNEEAAQDVSWLVEAYLYEAALPQLLRERDGDILRLAWSAGGGRPFPMPLDVRVGDKVVRIEMIDGVGSVDTGGVSPVVVDPQNKVLRRLPLTRTCGAQREAEEDRLRVRRARMAEEYGWSSVGE